MATPLRLKIEEQDEPTKVGKKEQIQDEEIALSNEDETDRHQLEDYTKAIQSIYSQNGESAASSSAVMGGLNPSSEYLQNVQSAMVPVQARPFAYNSKLDRLQPKAQKVRNTITRKKELVMETSEEAQLRYAREERKREREKIKRRWSKRKVTFENEVDYGNAYYHRAQRHLAARRKRQNVSHISIQNIGVKEEAEAEENLTEDVEYMSDESNNEQEDMLRRLTQQSIEDKKPPPIANKSSNDKVSSKQLNALLSSKNDTDILN